MNAPRLTVPLELESPEQVRDGMGGYWIEWRLLGRHYAQLTAGSGGEGLAEVGPRSAVSWRIVTRGFPDGDPRRPRPEQRFRMGNRLFLIEAVAERDAFGRFLTSYAREEMPA